ncbi:MAG: hypothetical protein DSZ24_06595 [Thermodesulfatator sp.]|nr:MAG: hypothetical protein DSZ24_06595 [Thermodesulfatator sp.]
MKEKRRYPRMSFECMRAYIPERRAFFEIQDISLKGCFFPMEDPPPPGTIFNLELELPGVGRIPARGMVMHQGKPGSPGAGIYFLDIEGGFYCVLAKFLKALRLIEDARKLYERILSSEEK